MTAHVLVVEDDPGVTTLLRTVLEDVGHHVTVAEDGLVGLVEQERGRPDAIVLDLMMPEIGGLRVLDELSGTPTLGRVLVVTGDPDAAAAARRRVGAQRVLIKPFDVDALVGIVADIVGAEG